MKSLQNHITEGFFNTANIGVSEDFERYTKILLDELNKFRWTEKWMLEKYGDFKTVGSIDGITAKHHDGSHMLQLICDELKIGKAFERKLEYKNKYICKIVYLIKDDKLKNFLLNYFYTEENLKVNEKTRKTRW